MITQAVNGVGEWKTKRTSTNDKLSIKYVSVYIPISEKKRLK